MSRVRPSPRQRERYAAQMLALVDMGHVGHERIVELGTEHGHFAEVLRRDGHGGDICGVDLWPEYVDLCRERGHYSEVWCADALTWGDYGDFAVAGEIIEHMDKDSGRVLLDRLELMPRKGAIITTPIGFMKMGAIEGNPHQEHKSGWLPEEFTDRGWRIVEVSKHSNFGCYRFEPKA